METIRTFIFLLRDSALNLLIGFVFFLIGTFIHAFIKMGFTFLFAPVAYARITSFSVLGYQFQRTGDKFVYVKKMPIPLTSAVSAFDIKKYPNVPAEKTEKRDLQSVLLTAICTLIVSVALGILLISAGKNLTGILFMFVVAVAIGLIFNGIMSLVFYFIVSHRLKTSLSGYLQKAITKIRGGASIESLNLKPESELPYEKISDYEHILYFSVYFMYLESCGELDKLDSAVASVKPYINKAKFSMSYILAYMSIVYYHCYYDVNPDEAMHYMSTIHQYLAKDTDANTYRVLGFYELAVKKNPDTAYEYANKALIAVESYSTGGEREQERICIDNLFKAIDEYVTQ